MTNEEIAELRRVFLKEGPESGSFFSKRLSELLYYHAPDFVVMLRDEQDRGKFTDDLVANNKKQEAENKKLRGALDEAIAASETGSQGDAIQVMLGILGEALR